MDELADGAEAIVIARALAHHADWDERGRIVTDIELEVEKSLKGEHHAKSVLVLRVLGGTIGDLGMRVEGEPWLAVGDRALVFARGGVGPGYYRPVGMSQGVLPIEKRDSGEVVIPGGSGLVLIDDGSDQAGPPAMLHPEPLPSVLDRLQGLMRRGSR